MRSLNCVVLCVAIICLTQCLLETTATVRVASDQRADGQSTFPLSQQRRRLLQDEMVPGAPEYSTINDTRVYSYTRYTLKPNQVDEFIAQYREAQQGASKLDGFVAFHVYKKLDQDDYYSWWNAWESEEDATEFLHSDTFEKLLEYLLIENVEGTRINIDPVA